MIRVNFCTANHHYLAVRAWLTAVVLTMFAALVVSLGVSSASAADTVAWTIRGVPQPTRFSHHDATRCEKYSGNCDRYQLLAANVSDVASSGPITVTDKLPPGITTAQTPESVGGEWVCTEGTTVTCTSEEPVLAGRDAYPITVFVTAPSVSASGSLKNEVSITGGGTAAVASTSEETLISAQPPPFGLSELGFEVGAADGTGSAQAAAHPWQVTTSFEIPVVELPGSEGELFEPVESMKDVVVELPLGLLGDPQAAAKCTQAELGHRQCPAGSSVGSVEIGAELTLDRFSFSHDNSYTSALYNMVPEGGYPAEFGFVYFGSAPIYLYASVVHSSSGYRLRIANPGLPDAVGAFGGAFTFYGEPAKIEGESSEAAFLTNPTRCTTEPQKARAEVESWENPGHPVEEVSTVYPQLTGCNLLQFNPSLTLAPSAAPEGGTTQADESSGYSFALKLPQTEAFSELATPELKDATVTLPEGVSVSPSAAQGLEGCPAEGPEAINISGPGSEEVGADGLKRQAKGRCPGASTLGTVEVCTPLLPNRANREGVKEEGEKACEEHDAIAPLQGHVYLAQPECGGTAQPECTDAYAEGKGGATKEGRLYGLYIEVEGDGVIVKLPGTVSANPATGRLQATFNENPQLPFGELKLQLKGGPRAPLANPQSCGSFATTSTLTSWAGQEEQSTSPSFNVDWDGKGGACPASLPFSPTFTAGTTIPTAGAFSPFTLSFSRQDREQDLSGLSVTLPPGLLGRIAGVPLCAEAQANAGSCGSESEIGSASVLAGPGEHPLYVPGGRVYLTTGYKGQPFGLSVVVPAVAGPFNLGNVVVRASIRIDPSTAQVTVVSDPFPQSKDGVPFRLRTVNVEVNRPGGFTFNPTNCSQMRVTGTISSAQGASANVASPFAVAGCRSLLFKPKFSVSTKTRASKATGTSLHVVVTSTPGQANIASVHVELPKKLPSRLTTLHKACLEATFNADPSSCPAASDVGAATARTPVLSVPLTGPAYLVSHGGAAFPDLVVVLQGEGVTIDLTGATHITKGITSSTFSSLPDAPISNFDLLLPQGPNSVLTATGNLCAKPLKMPTVITGQNGARIKQSTKIAVSGCRHKHKRRTKTKK